MNIECVVNSTNSLTLPKSPNLQPFNMDGRSCRIHMDLLHIFHFVNLMDFFKQSPLVLFHLGLEAGEN